MNEKEREEMIEKTREFLAENGYINDVVSDKFPAHEMADFALSVARQQWVAITERLPEKIDECYVVTYLASYNKKLNLEWLEWDGKTWNDPRRSFMEFDDGEILAWQERPDPYHPGETNA